MKDEVTYLKTSEIDRDKILLTIDASLQAYNAFNQDNPTQCHQESITVPEGYELVDSWTGVDAIFNRLKCVECYGIVLRSQQAPYTYVFAFRGTDGIEDLSDDFAFDYTSFQAHNRHAIVPPEVKVESGFYHIYSDRKDQIAPMQDQLFALVDKYQKSSKAINKLYVTGHSLGCTLCTLFALDLALSRPEIKAINYNFASPRVGNREFVDFYEQQVPQQNPETRTIRVQNVYDKIPCTPLTIQGYRYLPYAYLIAFYRNNLTGKFDIVDNHSVENYKRVLECTFNSISGSCEITLEGDRNRNIASVKPETTAICKYW